MERIISEAMEWLKNSNTEDMNVHGCITGSSLIGYFPDSNQDIDVFLYDHQSFRNLYNKMYFDNKFQIIDPLEKWKFNREVNYDEYKTQNLITIKFLYNNCLPINIILKKGKNNIFSVLSSFDMDIIAKGYDIFTNQVLDLTGDSLITKTADWNKWNTNFYTPDLWASKRLLRQLLRIIKYYKRGFDTDKVAKKYLNIIDKILEYPDNLFSKESFEEQLKEDKKKYSNMKKLIELWLETHNFSKKELEELDKLIRK